MRTPLKNFIFQFDKHTGKYTYVFNTLMFRYIPLFKTTNY